MSLTKVKSIAYILSGAAMFAFFSYLLAAPGVSIINIHYVEVDALWLTYSLGLSLMLGMIYLVIRDKDKNMTFKMSRTLSFWFINLPLTSIITFSLTMVIWPNSVDFFNPWIKSALPTSFMFISVLVIYGRTLHTRDKHDIERINIMGNTSQRQISIAIIFTLVTNVILAAEDWWILDALRDNVTYSILYATYLFTVSIFYLRNFYKITFKKYNNLLFTWVDPVLPEITFSLVGYYLLYTILISTIQGSFSSTLDMMVILGSIGLGLFGFIIVTYVLFKVSIIKYIKRLPLISEVLQLLDIVDIDDIHATKVDHSLILSQYYKYKKENDEKYIRRAQDKKDREYLVEWWRKELDKRKRA